MDNTTLLIEFKNYLSKKGITYMEVDFETLHFKFNQLDYVFQVDDRDDSYFRFILPNVLKITEHNKSQIRDYISSMNSEFKVGKIVEVSDDVWITAESFVYSFFSISLLFDRLIFLLLEIYKKSKDDLNKKI